MDKALADLVDRDAIRCLLQRYFRGVDRHDAGMITDCYWPDAGGDFKAWHGRLVDQPPFALALLKQHFANTNHVMGQCHIELRGDEAVSETYAIASHHLPDRGPGKAMTDIMWCRYIDRLERRDGEWRIAHRTFIVDQLLRAAETEAGPMNFADFNQGVPGPEDMSCALFKA